MTSSAKTPADYLAELPEDRAVYFSRLRETVLENLPDGFEETIDGMICYVVPKSIYPPGYHCDPKTPLPFVGIAVQKHFFALYHMGIYSDPELLVWFTEEWPKHTKRRLDMGKCCIRFAKMEQIPFDLIGQLIRKMSVDQWIEIYERERNEK